MKRILTADDESVASSVITHMRGFLERNTSDLLRHALPDGRPLDPKAPSPEMDNLRPEGLEMSATPSMDHEFLSVESYSEAQNRAAQRVLETLDRLDARTHRLYVGVRRHARYRVRRLVTVRLACAPDMDAGGWLPAPFRVWTSSLSSGGLSFIYPGPILQRKLFVGVPLADETLTWFRSEIVREQEMTEEGFWEFGAVFWDRIAPERRPDQPDTRPQEEATGV